MPNFVTKYVIFCELWEKMSVPDIKNLGLVVTKHCPLVDICFEFLLIIKRFVLGNLGRAWYVPFNHKAFVRGATI